MAFEPEAEDELEAAVDCYEERRPGLGLRLILAIDGAIARIAAQPRAHSEVARVVASVVVRRAHVVGFPYSVAFVELENELRVIAIAHDKRKPGYWLKRLDRQRYEYGNDSTHCLIGSTGPQRGLRSRSRSRSRSSTAPSRV